MRNPVTTLTTAWFCDLLLDLTTFDKWQRAKQENLKLLAYHDLNMRTSNLLGQKTPEALDVLGSNL